MSLPLGHGEYVRLTVRATATQPLIVKTYAMPMYGPARFFEVVFVTQVTQVRPMFGLIDTDYEEAR